MVSSIRSKLVDEMDLQMLTTSWSHRKVQAYPLVNERNKVPLPKAPNCSPVTDMSCTTTRNRSPSDTWSALRHENTNRQSYSQFYSQSKKTKKMLCMARLCINTKKIYPIKLYPAANDKTNLFLSPPNNYIFRLYSLRTKIGP